MKNIFEKSVVTSKALAKGSLIDLQSIAFKKPGTGIKAADYKTVLVKRINRELPKDYLIKKEDLE